MTAQRIAMGGSRRAVGVLVLLGLAGLPFAGGGCKDLPAQKEGQRCGGEYGACARGLRCSFKKKRCYRPVDCALLDRRLKACLPEVLDVYEPRAAKLPAQQRSRLLERIGQQLHTDMVGHCKHDAAAYQKKHGQAPSLTKSYGEDPRAAEVTACLQHQECRPLAQCLLGLARVVGPKRPDPKDPKVFPLAPPPRPAPDAGAPPAGAKPAPTADMDPPAADTDTPATGMDAMKPAMPAAPAPGVMKPAPGAMKPASGVMKPAMPATPAPRAMKPAMPAPRPR